MKQKIIATLGLFLVLSAAACGSTSSPQSPAAGEQRQELVAKGDCTFEACSSLPSSYAAEPKVECSSADGAACEWVAGDELEQSVSYGFCKDSECPPRPALDCPSGTAQASQQCGNENNRGCAWMTTCAPPRVTAPCPSATGCDGQPILEIGIICKDGSTGEFVCVTDNKACFWERNCD